ncbi:hypothetical protein ACHAXA_008212 [Cyclostephanos tholiformis]|uniref:Uncharacterized protein n=1 Tax=Cyclostephanos tholiformis TaxID=382380 RepID=A0ABD3SCN4_9STRA
MSDLPICWGPTSSNSTGGVTTISSRIATTKSPSMLANRKNKGLEVNTPPFSSLETIGTYHRPLQKK